MNTREILESYYGAITFSEVELRERGTSLEVEYNGFSCPSALLTSLAGLEIDVKHHAVDLRTDKWNDPEVKELASMLLSITDRLFTRGEGNRVYHHYTRVRRGDARLAVDSLPEEVQDDIQQFVIEQQNSVSRVMSCFQNSGVFTRLSYRWGGTQSDLLEFGNFLFVTEAVLSVGENKTKQAFFRMLFRLFGLPFPEKSFQQHLHSAVYRGNSMVFLDRLRLSYKQYVDKRFH